MNISEESGTVLKYLEERDRVARFARYARLTVVMDMRILESKKGVLETS